MNARIVNFQMLWNATVIPLPPPLVRQTNRYCLLSVADLARWRESKTGEERERIIRENDIRLEADERRRQAGNYTQEELDDMADFNRRLQETAPAPLHNPLDYYDPDADEIYDMAYAAY
jgi:hypothetical protein